jgi:hypothetical protein
LLFAKKYLTKTNQCAGVLSWRRIHLLVIYFSGCFLLTASLRDKGCRCTFDIHFLIHSLPSGMNL